jgi:hypothetical protein
MPDILGSVLDISLYGENINSGDVLSSSLVSTYGYIRFVTDDSGYIANHTERALDLLIEQFRKDKPLLHGFITAFTTSMQEVENILFDLTRFMSIETANGAQLDGIGDILGLPRTSGDDDIYRDDLIFQIFLNTSNGEPETLIQALDRLVKANRIDYAEQYPASAILIINEAAAPIPSNLSQRMNAIAPSGVQIFTYLNNSATPFIFDGEGIFPPAYTGEGFGETGVLWTGVGGNITELLT